MILFFNMDQKSAGERQHALTAILSADTLYFYDKTFMPASLQKYTREKTVKIGQMSSNYLLETLEEWLLDYAYTAVVQIYCKNLTFLFAEFTSLAKRYNTALNEKDKNMIRIIEFGAFGMSCIENQMSYLKDIETQTVDLPDDTITNLDKWYEKILETLDEEYEHYKQLYKQNRTVFGSVAESAERLLKSFDIYLDLLPMAEINSGVFFFKDNEIAKALRTGRNEHLYKDNNSFIEWMVRIYEQGPKSDKHFMLAEIVGSSRYGGTVNADNCLVSVLVNVPYIRELFGVGTRDSVILSLLAHLYFYVTKKNAPEVYVHAANTLIGLYTLLLSDMKRYEDTQYQILVDPDKNPLSTALTTGQKLSRDKYIDVMATLHLVGEEKNVIENVMNYYASSELERIYLLYIEDMLKKY